MARTSPWRRPAHGTGGDHRRRARRRDRRFRHGDGGDGGLAGTRRCWSSRRSRATAARPPVRAAGCGFRAPGSPPSKASRSRRARRRLISSTRRRRTSTRSAWMPSSRTDPRRSTSSPSNTCVQFDMPPVFPDYHAEAPGGQPGGRSMVTRPFDGRELGARIKQLAPPLPELTVFGMMLGSGPEIRHFMRAFKSLDVVCLRHQAPEPALPRRAHARPRHDAHQRQRARRVAWRRPRWISTSRCGFLLP